MPNSIFVEKICLVARGITPAPGIISYSHGFIYRLQLFRATASQWLWTALFVLMGSDKREFLTFQDYCASPTQRSRRQVWPVATGLLETGYQQSLHLAVK